MNLTNINWNTVLSYIGAAAWVPQVLGWLYNFFVKSIVMIKADKVITIGYTLLGPLINLRLAINVDKKDTLIDCIGIEIRHQDGSKYFFEWMRMTEILSEIKNDKNQNQIIQRDVSPIRLKLSMAASCERDFGFRNLNFFNKNNSEIKKLEEIKNYMMKKHQNYHDLFLTCKQFEDYLKFMREGFCWKAGAYEMTFYMRSPKRFKLKKEKLKFNLAQDDVDKLRRNLELLRSDIEYLIKKQDIPDFNGELANWGWINTTFI